MTHTSLDLRTPLSSLPGVDPPKIDALQSLGLTTVADLIKHAPRGYEENRGGITIAEADALLGERERCGDLVTIDAVVTAMRPRRGRTRRVEVEVEDDSGTMTVNWFNQSWVARKLHPDTQIRLHGTLSRYKDSLQMANPRFHEIDIDDPPPSPSECLAPVYPAGDGVTSPFIARLVEQVLDDALPHIEDHFPDDFRRERSLPTLAEAWRLMHRPAGEEDVREGRRRLAYDELLMLQLGVMRRRHVRQSTLHALPLRWDDEIRSRIAARVPFTLTASQERVIEEIAGDLVGQTPMNRLLQGDVGSGKTVVAVHAMLMAVACGHQAALMAPTELLAEQHFQTLCELLAGSKVRLALLTSSLPAARRSETIAGIADGSIDIVVGTHALLTGDVTFRSVAVAVIDEQHRFGVHQRATLRSKAGDEHGVPHALVMTATPIPRTLSLTIFGDLDVSTISGLPPGRTPITTRLVEPDNAVKVYGHLADLVSRGQQGYVVVPLVDDTDSGLKAVTTHTDMLQDGYLQGCRVAGVHGRTKADERERIMRQFREGELDVLVATTVIEVGVDVPNATMMVIEHADRFGLSQLHQLRGRVGRGELPGVCAMIAESSTEDAQKRLEAIVETTDGFVIAERDLEIRGPGELFGARQSGLAPFRIARLPRDFDLLRMARRDAIDWIARNPDLSDAPLLRARLLKAFGEGLGLGDVA
jgi:ATP-dependent DNA helicase RecG